MKPAAIAALSLVLLALLAQAAVMLAALRLRRRFYRELGPVVRIATPCRVVEGRRLVPGALGLSPEGLRWNALTGIRGAAPFDRVQRLETDARLSDGGVLMRSQVVRVTLTSGEAKEFVVSRPHSWEWRRALGEWVGKSRPAPG